MTNLKDEIAGIVFSHSVSSVGAPKSPEETAQAIIGLIIARIPPLVWGRHGGGYKSEAFNGEYAAHPTANTHNEKFVVYHICAKGKSWTVGYVSGPEAAKAAANAHHVSQLCKGMGIG